jgi:Fic family protein
MLKFKYQETTEIKKLLIELEALKIVFEQVKSLPQFEENLRRESLLKSALFSARVEGNPLSLEKIKFASKDEKTTDIKKLEVFNLISAYKLVLGSKAPKKLDLGFIKKLHQITMENLSSNAGRFRTETWAIFNQAGIVIYLTPAPFRLPKLMPGYIQTSQKLKYEIPIKAAILQFLFEKIHPFADGNGRVGRLISAYIMKKGGYDFRGLVSMEEMIDKNRKEYYQVLEPSQDATLFVEFFLESFVEQAKLVLNKLSEKGEELPEDYLLPRRREILAMITDHPYSTFDFIYRRFPAVNIKTLHYDLGQLQKKGFIIKIGKTRGASYKIRK